MHWIRKRVCPPLASRTASTSCAEAGDEAVVPDAEQRPARDVADAGRLDDEHARAARGEAAVPVEDLRRDEAVLGRAPGHHRRDPRPRARDDPAAEADRREPAAAAGLLGRRPADRAEADDWILPGVQVPDTVSPSPNHRGATKGVDHGNEFTPGEESEPRQASPKPPEEAEESDQDLIA